jgi:hypothetical protein
MADQLHDQCIIAVQKGTGKLFGGRRSHIGYAKEGPLKSSLTIAGENHEDYYFVGIRFDKQGLPTLTLLEGSPESLLDLIPEEDN